MSAAEGSSSSSGMKLIDIGANLTDPVFTGMYRGKRKHQDDFSDMLARAAAAGVEKILVTGGSLEESRRAVELCKRQHSSVQLACTVGCHPTRTGEMERGDSQQYLQKLVSLIEQNPGVVAAFGEMGLDFDREQFAARDVQIRHFRSQLEAACSVQLPMFLHCRASQQEMTSLLKQFSDRLPHGVVHSFDGDLEEALALLDLGLDIGLNGCSLREERSLRVVSQLPLDRIHLETDAPWCEVKPTHAGYSHAEPHIKRLDTKKPERWTPGCFVKSRNESARLKEVLAIVASAMQRPEAEVAAAAYANSKRMFFPDRTQQHHHDDGDK